MPALRRLLEAPDGPEASAVDEFLNANNSPIVDESSVTFLYRGEVDEVRLRHFIMGFPTLQPFRRVKDTDLWFLTMQIPNGSRVEYKLELVRGDRRKLVLDPLNENTARDPFGVNSVCYAAGYARPEWTLPDPDARPGRLDALTIRSDIYDADVDLRVYMPARPARYPSLPVAGRVRR